MNKRVKKNPRERAIKWRNSNQKTFDERNTSTSQLFRCSAFFSFEFFCAIEALLPELTERHGRAVRLKR